MMQAPVVSYEFGPFVLAPSEQRLWHAGQPIHLPPKAFDLLVTLAVANRRLVEKAELLKTIWPDTHVEEANLAQTVSLIRKALGRAPGGALYIETVPKKGYRMAVEVRKIGGGQAMTQPPSSPERSLRWKPILSVGAVVGAALAAIILFRLFAGL
ncbi:MAG: transcriptional regulator [Acidobacteriales bacterium]|nr:transcriptional regulator [Terriglobales bacterium]